MSTRGLVGFRSKNHDYCWFNHWDSYPGYFGLRVTRWLAKYLRSNTVQDLQDQVQNLIGLKDYPPSPLTQEIKKRLKDAGVPIQKIKPHQVLDLDDKHAIGMVDWSGTLNDFQQEIQGVLEMGLYIDDKNFIHDSLFCEWAYIVNLDEGVLEVYKGFIKRDWPVTGRYQKIPKRFEWHNFKGKRHKSPIEYRSCSLVRTYELNLQTIRFARTDMKRLSDQLDLTKKQDREIWGKGGYQLNDPDLPEKQASHDAIMKELIREPIRYGISEDGKVRIDKGTWKS